MLDRSRIKVSYSDRYGEALFRAGMARALRLMIPLIGNDVLPDRIVTALKALADPVPIIAADQRLAQTTNV